MSAPDALLVRRDELQTALTLATEDVAAAVREQMIASARLSECERAIAACIANPNEPALEPVRERHGRRDITALVRGILDNSLGRTLSLPAIALLLPGVRRSEIEKALNRLNAIDIAPQLGMVEPCWRLPQSAGEPVQQEAADE